MCSTVSSFPHGTGTRVSCKGTNCIALVVAKSLRAVEIRPLMLPLYHTEIFGVSFHVLSLATGLQSICHISMLLILYSFWILFFWLRLFVWGAPQRSDVAALVPRKYILRPSTVRYSQMIRNILDSWAPLTPILHLSVYVHNCANSCISSFDICDQALEFTVMHIVYEFIWSIVFINVYNFHSALKL